MITNFTVTEEWEGIEKSQTEKAGEGLITFRKKTVLCDTLNQYRIIVTVSL